MDRLSRTNALLVLSLLIAVACKDESVWAPASYLNLIRVTATTSGAARDMDYRVTICDPQADVPCPPHELRDGDTLTMRRDSTERYEVSLGDVAGNCSVVGGEHAFVPSGSGLAELHFRVTCVEPHSTSRFRITTRTTGAALDGSYQLLTCGHPADESCPSSPIRDGDTITVPRGHRSYYFYLSDVSANCQVTNGNGRRIPEGLDDMDIEFDVQCASATGGVRLTRAARRSRSSASGRRPRSRGRTPAGPAAGRPRQAGA